MKVLFLACCESVALDAATNRLSLFHLTDEFNSPAFPAVVSSIAMVLILERAAEEQEPNVQFRVMLDEQQLFTGGVNVPFQGKLRARGIVAINGLLIPRPGTLKFEVMINDQALGSWNIEVHNIARVANAAAPAVQV
jgi:hypothetical protein